MRKKLGTMISLASTLWIIMIIATSCSSSPSDWPSTEEMVKNLKAKGYTIVEDNKVVIDNQEFTGTVIIATKGSEFVAGFWSENIESADAVYDYWGKKYKSDYTLRVGTDVYCGTKKAVKHAGINVR